MDLANPDKTMTITTENLNGEFVAVNGKVESFKLQAPTVPIRARPWEAPDQPMLTQEEFQQLFPHDAYSDAADPRVWPKEKLINGRKTSATTKAPATPPHTSSSTMYRKEFMYSNTICA